MKYTVDYFIKKFKAIPKKEWTTGDIVNNLGQKCALGHCNTIVKDSYYIHTEEGNALNWLMKGLDCNTTDVNDDNYNEFKKLGKHPKTRVVNALKEIKRISK